MLNKKFQICFRVKNSFWCRKIFIWAFKHLRKRSWKFWRDLTTAWPFVPVLTPRAPKKHNNRLRSLLQLSFLECYRLSRPPGPCTLRNIRLSAKIVISLLTPRLSAWPLRGHRVLKSILEDILQPTKSKMSPT